MPRKSQLRTTTAVLRAIIGLSDREMAALLECSPDAIRSLESARETRGPDGQLALIPRLKLSESMARRMSLATGISAAWLLAGDPKAPPFTVQGAPFTKERFEFHAACADQFDTADTWTFSRDFIVFATRLRRILSQANLTHNYQLARYKTSRALTALQAEFSQPPATPPSPQKAQRAAPIPVTEKTVQSTRDPVRKKAFQQMLKARDEQHDSNQPADIAEILKNDIDRYLFATTKSPGPHATGPTATGPKATGPNRTDPHATGTSADAGASDATGDTSGEDLTGEAIKAALEKHPAGPAEFTWPWAKRKPAPPIPPQEIKRRKQEAAKLFQAGRDLLAKATAKATTKASPANADPAKK